MYERTDTLTDLQTCRQQTDGLIYGRTEGYTDGPRDIDGQKTDGLINRCSDRGGA